MSDRPLACIILAAGQGKRMKSSRPKVMHRLAGRPLIGWLLESARTLGAEKIVIVTSPAGQEEIAKATGVQTVIQQDARGTGDAVKAALPALAGFTGDVLILLGDMPLITPETLKALIAQRHKDADTGLAVLGAEFEHPPAFGRLVLGADGALEKIIEDKDCSAAERNIRFCNIGAFCVDGARLAGWVGKIGSNNAQGEFYITDLPAIAAKDDIKTHACITRDHNEIHGVNSRADLAALEAIVQQKLRARAMEGGATLVDPGSTYFSWDTALGQDVLIEPGVIFGPGVSVGDDVTIYAYSHIEGAQIASHVKIGPFARIRPHSIIEDNVSVGNFIEVNRSHMKKGSKAKHVTYLGDTTVGEKANIGAGTVVANYDGYEKLSTNIGTGAFIGSNVTIVAPLQVGDGAIVAAGSTVTYDIPDDALAIARVEGDVRPGWALERRKKKSG